MATLMMTVELDPKQADLAHVMRRFGLTSGEIDEAFGVVSLRPEDNLYAVLVDEDAASKLGGPGVNGPYSNPRIEAFGPPRP